MIVPDQTIKPATGKYYFEVQFGTITGVVFIGLADVSIAASNAVGVSGWSIASHSRTFNKQGGGGTTWEVEQERLFLVMLSVVYDSDLGSLTFIRITY
jgi:hypothetical protein